MINKLLYMDKFNDLFIFIPQLQHKFPNLREETTSPQKHSLIKDRLKVRNHPNLLHEQPSKLAFKSPHSLKIESFKLITRNHPPELYKIRQ